MFGYDFVTFWAFHLSEILGSTIRALNKTWSTCMLSSIDSPCATCGSIPSITTAHSSTQAHPSDWSVLYNSRIPQILLLRTSDPKASSLSNEADSMARSSFALSLPPLICREGLRILCQEFYSHFPKDCVSILLTNSAKVGKWHACSLTPWFHIRMYTSPTFCSSLSMSCS